MSGVHIDAAATGARAHAVGDGAARTDGRTRFQRYRDDLVHDWMKILAVLGVVLIPLFLVLDFYTMPRELLGRFAVYRGTATVAVLIQLIVLRATAPNRFSFIHGYVFSALVSGMIVLMTLDLGGFNSGYYVGLMLVIFPVNVLLPWRAVHSAINGIIGVGLYLVANLSVATEVPVSALINNLYFLCGMVIIVVAISETRYRLIEREFLLRAELQDTNQTLEKSRADLKAARDSLWSEMEVAQRIQTALLPTNRTLGAWEATAVMRPAEEVGGDYYDFLQTRHGEHWVGIGDVSGHGVESGLVMMMTQTSIAALVDDLPNRSPAQVFAHTNRIIRENVSRLGSTRYMTLNIVRLHADRITVTGKHQDILIWRSAEDRLERVSNEGSWIGVFEDVTDAVEDLEIRIGVGDCVFLFTDGLTEATNASGEMYGQDRLEASFARLARLGGRMALPDIVEALLGEVRAFAAKQDDDMTLVLLQRTR